MGQREVVYRDLVGKHGVSGLNSRGSRQYPVTVCCEQGNYPAGHIKGGEFLDQFTFIIRPLNATVVDDSRTLVLNVHARTLAGLRITFRP
jgi:hypothetical protein